MGREPAASFASPILAGIQALINQYTGKRQQGNPNPVYYSIAAGEYGTTGIRLLQLLQRQCGAAGSCTFYDVT